MADDVKIPRVLFVGNLVQDEEDRQFLIDSLGESPVAFFPDSSTIRKAERSETAIIDLEEGLESAPEQLLQAVNAK